MLNMWEKKFKYRCFETLSWLSVMWLFSDNLKSISTKGYELDLNLLFYIFRYSLFDEHRIPFPFLCQPVNNTTLDQGGKARIQECILRSYSHVLQRNVFPPCTWASLTGLFLSEINSICGCPENVNPES